METRQRVMPIASALLISIEICVLALEGEHFHTHRSAPKNATALLPRRQRPFFRRQLAGP
jgi:hypothetical protein